MGFRFVLIIGIALIQAVLFALVILFGLNWLLQSHNRELQGHAQDAARLLAASVAIPMHAGDAAGVMPLLSNIGAASGLRHVRVFDTDGEQIARWPHADRLSGTRAADAGQVDVPVASTSRIDPAPDPLRETPMETGTDQRTIDAVVPVIIDGQRLGRVELGLSAAGVDAVMAKSERVAVALALLQAALLGGVFMVFARRHARDPVQSQRGAEVAVADGPQVQRAVPQDPESHQAAVDPPVPSSRLVPPAAAKGPIDEADASDDITERLTQCAASAAPLLLAEDSRINQLVATTILRKEGFRVDLVENGREAVAAVGSSDYGLVLMDVAMPEMDGLEATRCIRALPGKRGRVPIIAMTANAFDEHRQRCLEAGMDDYLTKPVERRTLFRVLLRWLDTSPLESSAASTPVPVPAPVTLASQTERDWPVTDPASADDGRAAALATPSGESPFDEDVIATLAADLSAELMPAAVATFIDEAIQRIQSIEHAAAVGDAKRAGDEGHTLKGSAVTFGARALRETAFAIEEAGRAGSIDGVRHELEALRNRGDAAINLLRERFCAAPESEPAPKNEATDLPRA